MFKNLDQSLVIFSLLLWWVLRAGFDSFTTVLLFVRIHICVRPFRTTCLFTLTKVVPLLSRLLSKNSLSRKVWDARMFFPVSGIPVISDLSPQFSFNCRLAENLVAIGDAH